ncbi:MAG: hypothetical protein A3D28_02875 [Omnitrophica bacterium RIFCSPHIGHO2_02_FULL_63_14]|nr:MAG: hypothetical protein A3D28_02875 [Omnitrophica bacterium RIFCSPHIGHO2_02_FULL_63_14]
MLIVIMLAAAAALCYLLTPLFIRAAHRFGLLDYPQELKLHPKPVPFLGGMAVFVSFWTIVFAGIYTSRFFLEHSLVPPSDLHVLLSGIVSVARKIVWIFIGGAAILAVGFFDDKYRWSPLRKLLGQIAASLVLMSQGLTINLVEPLGPLGYLATFVWVLLIINAFNFIDSLDGHCAGIAIVSGMMLLWITQIIDQPFTALFLAAFTGALVGFFPYNFKPARIFLGDNGSLFIGYMMAAFTLLCRYYTPQATYATAFIPVLIFGVPLYDSVSVIAVRLYRGLPPWKGDRNHFAHRLVKMGMSDRVAVAFSFLIAIAIGHLAILLTQVDWFGASLVGIVYFFMIIIIALLEYYAARRQHFVEQLSGENKRRREDVDKAMGL